MECKVLDKNFASSNILDGWFSFIWTERYAKDSDFVIELPANPYYYGLVTEGTLLMINESTQPMVVETTYITKQNGEDRYKIQGRDLVSWLETRNSPWNVSYVGARPTEIAKDMMNRAIYTAPTLDRMPGTSVTNTDTSTNTISFETGNGDLLEEMRTVLNNGDASIRADRVLNSGVYSILYSLYKGKKTDLSFSESDGTLVNANKVYSKKKYRNIASVAYRASDDQDAGTLFRLIYTDGSENLGGRDRRYLRIDATNLRYADYPGDRMTSMVDTLGREALGKAKIINAVDGEVPSYVTAKYGTDYNLGDLVTLRADDNTPTEARVTEFIRTIDASGYRTFPTIEPTTSQSI